MRFAAGFIRPLLEGIVVGNTSRTIGPIIVEFLTTWLWLVLVTVFASGAMWGSSRHAGTLLVLLALVLAVPLTVTAIGGVGGAVSGALMMIGAFLLMYYPAGWLWLAVAVLGLVGLTLLLARREARWSSRVLFGTLAIVTLVVGIRVHGFVGGRRGDLDVGPIPRGVPVNLVMNIDPQKAIRMPAALIGLVRAVAQINREGLSGDRAYEVFAETAGPGLIAASKVPDMVLDRGHWFGEALTDDEKKALIAFLKTI